MEWLLKNIVYQPIVKKHLSLLFIGSALGILIYGFVNFNLLQSTKEMYLSGFLGVLTLYLTVLTNGVLNRLVPFKKFPGLRILVGIVWSTVFSFFLAYIGFILYLGISGHQMDTTLRYEVFTKLAILLFCAALLYNIIYFALYSYNDYAKGQLMALQLERKQDELRLLTLKSQLSPHFLFNSINSLTALFRKDVERAEVFIRSLAKSYQYTLEKYGANTVAFREELSFVEAYLFLVKTRFGDACTVAIAIDQTVFDKQIPPLTLQLLVENAVKHNSFDLERPLKIRISNTASTLIISNNKTENKIQVSSTKIGLKNIKARYELLTNQAVEVFDETQFTVKIPLL
ncbi:histidine kinase [Croceitalea sp. MTPC5]|nr:histidine kinase [Croceitalea sp. MTPC5]